MGIGKTKNPAVTIGINVTITAHSFVTGNIINKINDNAVPTPNIIKSTGLKNQNISALLLLLAGTKNV